jgi:hypothetical protein
MGESRNASNTLIFKPEEKRPLWRTRRRWDYNNGTDLKETLNEGVDRIHLAQDRVKKQAIVSAVMNLLVLFKASDFLMD